MYCAIYNMGRDMLMELKKKKKKCQNGQQSINDENRYECSKKEIELNMKWTISLIINTNNNVWSDHYTDNCISSYNEELESQLGLVISIGNQK